MKAETLESSRRPVTNPGTLQQLSLPGFAEKLRHMGWDVLLAKSGEERRGGPSGVLLCVGWAGWAGSAFQACYSLFSSSEDDSALLMGRFPAFLFEALGPAVSRKRLKGTMWVYSGEG